MQGSIERLGGVERGLGHDLRRRGRSSGRAAIGGLVGPCDAAHELGCIDRDPDGTHGGVVLQIGHHAIAPLRFRLVERPVGAFDPGQLGFFGAQL